MMSVPLETFDRLIKIVKWKIPFSLETSTIRKEIRSPSFMLDKKRLEMSFVFENYVSYAVIGLELIEKDSTDEKLNYEIGIEKFDGAVCLDKNMPFLSAIGKAEKVPISAHFNFLNIEEVRGLTAVCMVHLEKCSITQNKGVSTETVFLESAILTLSKNYKELLASGRHADVTIKVGNKEFKAHKSVLAARSPVLDSMFSSDMLESNTGILQITDTDEDTFEDFLTFIYTARIEEVSLNKIKTLYEIADKYNLPELKTACVKRFMVEMSVESVCDALRVSTVHDEKPLLKTATEFFIDNAEKVFESKCWSLFLKDHPDVANELFKKCFRARLK